MTNPNLYILWCSLCYLVLKKGLQPYKWTWLTADLLLLFWGVGELWCKTWFSNDFVWTLPTNPPHRNTGPLIFQRALVLNKTNYYNKLLLVSALFTKVKIIAHRHSSFWITPIKTNRDERKLCLFVLKKGGKKCDEHPHMKLEGSLICVWSGKCPAAPPKLDSGRCYKRERKKQNKTKQKNSAKVHHTSWFYACLAILQMLFMLT